MIMKQKKKLVIVMAYSILLLIIAGVNIKLKFITVPTVGKMVERQLDYITISTVFAGFSFTSLGLLLGLSSEKLIEKIRNTDIIMNKVGRIMKSIIFFILSVIVSLFFVLGLNKSLISNVQISSVIDSILYIFSVGYLIGGIGYFIYAVYELYDLVKRIYGYNKEETNKMLDKVQTEMEATRTKMRELEMSDQK